MSTIEKKDPAIQKKDPELEGHTVIAFGYKKHSGKDAAGGALADAGYEKRAFANPIKEAIGKGVFGFSGEQCHGGEKGAVDDYWGVSPGEIFQVVGTELFRKGLQEEFPEQFDGQIWARAECRELIERQNRGQHGKYVFTDLRFPDEAEFLREHFGATCVEVRAPREMREEWSGEDLRDDDHASETAMDGWEGWDYHIHNVDTLKHLRLNARIIMRLEEGRTVPGIPSHLEVSDRVWKTLNADPVQAPQVSTGLIFGDKAPYDHA
ncbi:hypothetical protein [Salinibacter ruber]|uniref:Uncharacterized protein n=1 Tax=Salinibacter ruber TaxID=146919 RepID=A0AAW5P6X3_9BACT|nr:hypothetical protein [Salinibacter ruber]MCS4157638.1 hypothetical protein [Salinibacter ruber]